MQALAESENRPETIYLGDTYQPDSDALVSCNMTEEEALAFGFNFVLFTQGNPYENGTANDNFTYWSIGDPWFRITRQDTPVLWEKPAGTGE